MLERLGRKDQSGPLRASNTAHTPLDEDRGMQRSFNSLGPLVADDWKRVGPPILGCDWHALVFEMAETRSTVKLWVVSGATQEATNKATQHGLAAYALAKIVINRSEKGNFERDIRIRFWHEEDACRVELLAKLRRRPTLLWRARCGMKRKTKRLRAARKTCMEETPTTTQAKRGLGTTALVSRR